MRRLLQEGEFDSVASYLALEVNSKKETCRYECVRTSRRTGVNQKST
jgi:hypothetical protein